MAVHPDEGVQIAQPLGKVALEDVSCHAPALQRRHPLGIELISSPRNPLPVEPPSQEVSLGSAVTLRYIGVAVLFDEGVQVFQLFREGSSFCHGVEFPGNAPGISNSALCQ
jgi:hypothetical protein